MPELQESCRARLATHLCVIYNHFGLVIVSLSFARKRDEPIFAILKLGPINDLILFSASQIQRSSSLPVE
jgi:hypothetical protein